jgi:hypothetical protein
MKVRHSSDAAVTSQHHFSASASPYRRRSLNLVWLHLGASAGWIADEILYYDLCASPPVSFVVPGMAETLFLILCSFFTLGSLLLATAGAGYDLKTPPRHARRSC